MLDQSWSPDELFLIDDGSTDGSMPILESLARDPRVRLVRHERNEGFARSMADGFGRCVGDYVFMPAADDLVLPGFFEKSMGMLAVHPEAGLSCTLSGIIDADGRDLGLFRTPVIRDRPSYLSPREYFEEFRRHGNFVSTTSTIFRRKAMLEAGGCPVELDITIDGFLIQTLSVRYGMCFIPERLVMWRPSETSMSSTSSHDIRRSLNIIETQDAWFAALRPPDVTVEHRSLLKRMALNATIDHLTRRRPFPTEEARLLAARIPGGGAALLLYRLALALGGGWAATKLYLFSLLAPREQARAIANKFFRAEAAGPRP